MRVDAVFVITILLTISSVVGLAWSEGPSARPAAPSNSVSVFVLAIGQAGVIQTTYSFPNDSASGTATLWANLMNVTVAPGSSNARSCTYWHNGTSTLPALCPGLTANVTPQTISYSSGESVDVTFGISSASGAPGGFYLLQISGQCSALWIFVGDSSPINLPKGYAGLSESTCISNLGFNPDVAIQGAVNMKIVRIQS